MAKLTLDLQLAEDLLEEGRAGTSGFKTCELQETLQKLLGGP
ncbi:MAG: hypothetical protein CM1200mP35_05200 [Chloroflexota bacterium]|nr:MAG: hypothetical protein CM1200mP35_05200 [Chloroflexota bacterium]